MGGTHKGLIRCPDGRSVIEHLLAAFASAGIERQMISTNQPEHYRRFERPMVPDRLPGCGPLGGMEAAMGFALAQGAEENDRVVFAPCDMPDVAAVELTALLESARTTGLAMASFGGETQPLVCAVSPAWLPAVRDALDSGRLSVVGLWERCGAVRVEMPRARAGVNLNTCSDVAAWYKAPR